MQDRENTPETQTFQGASQTIGKLVGAMARAQGCIPQPEKTKVARIPLKSGGSYTYRYCDIADILKVALPCLSKEELSLFQFSSHKIQEDGRVLVTVRSVLAHSSGEWVENQITADADSTAVQSIGSAITYLRRYGSQLLLGIAAEEDDDGEAGHGNQPGGARNNQATQNKADGDFQDVVEEITSEDKTGKTLYRVRTGAHGVLDTFKADLVDGLRAVVGTGQLVQFRAEANQYGSRLIGSGPVDPDAGTSAPPAGDLPPLPSEPPPERQAPEPPPESGAKPLTIEATVTKVAEKAGKNGPRYGIQLSNGQWVNTFDKKHAEFCRAREGKGAGLIFWVEKTQFGLDLLNVEAK